MSLLSDLVGVHEFDIGPNLRDILELAIAGFILWRTETVRRELKPNGGGSVRDALDAVHNRLDALGVPKAPVDRDAKGDPTAPHD